jgi:hypothetical protein
MVPVSAAAAVAPLPLPLWLFCLVDLVMGWFLRGLLNRQYEAQRAGTGQFAVPVSPYRLDRK